jgi:hypothetical protein
MRNKLDACRIYPFDREAIAECPITGQVASFPADGMIVFDVFYS